MNLAAVGDARYSHASLPKPDANVRIGPLGANRGLVDWGLAAFRLCNAHARSDVLG
jgi:hypothetical protein